MDCSCAAGKETADPVSFLTMSADGGGADVTQIYRPGTIWKSAGYGFGGGEGLANECDYAVAGFTWWFADDPVNFVVCEVVFLPPSHARIKQVVIQSFFYCFNYFAHAQSK